VIKLALDAGPKPGMLRSGSTAGSEIETMDAIAQFKEQQRKSWSTFAPSELYTCQPAARLVTFARIRSGQRVLDIGCGTGVVALAAARTGARVTGLDLTPDLLVRAAENAAIAELDIDWHEGDVEELPFDDASYDVVVSQFGHMFAPRPDVATHEMLRVLKPGGTIAFSTWPPELFVGKMFGLTARFLPPLPPGISPPAQWGEPSIFRERLASRVTSLDFDRATMRASALSPQHMRKFLELNVGPVMRIVQTLARDAARLVEFRRAVDGLMALYFDLSENVLRRTTS
jgi:SAM-dependent methyltransferase